MWHFVQMVIDVFIFSVVMFFIQIKNNRIFDCLIALNSQISQINLRLNEIAPSENNFDQTKLPVPLPLPFIPLPLPLPVSVPQAITKLDFDIPEGSIQISDIEPEILDDEINQNNKIFEQ